MFMFLFATNLNNTFSKTFYVPRKGELEREGWEKERERKIKKSKNNGFGAN